MIGIRGTGRWRGELEGNLKADMLGPSQDTLRVKLG